MVNGEERFKVKASYYKAAQLTKLQALGVQVTAVPDSKPAEIELDIPQNAMFFDPSLVSTVGLGPLLVRAGQMNRATRTTSRSTTHCAASCSTSRGSGPNRLNASPNRPKPGASAWSRISARSTSSARGTPACPPTTSCAKRSGLNAKSTFTQVTGESTEELPADDPLVSKTDPIDDPHILDFTSLKNYYGEPITPGSGERAVYGTRRTTLAARLKAIYGSVEASILTSG